MLHNSLLHYALGSVQHFQNKIIPTTYLVNNKLDLIDKKNLTPDKWFEMDRNKNLIQLLLEN